MLKIFINTNRPGDFFLWAARICQLEKVLSSNDIDILITEDALFLDLIPLFKGFLNENNFKLSKGKISIKDYHIAHRSAGSEIIKGYDFNGFYEKMQSYYSHKTKISENIIYCFVTLECEKRKLHSQYEILKTFKEKILEKLGKKTVFINNGMTSTLARELLLKSSEQKEFEVSIFNKLKDDHCDFISLYGESIPNKLLKLSDCHCAISSLGTASILPYSLNIPTFSFGNKYLHRACKKRSITRKNNKSVVIPLSKTKIMSIEDNFTESSFKIKEQLLSYDIDKKYYSLYMDQFIKNIEIKKTNGFTKILNNLFRKF